MTYHFNLTIPTELNKDGEIKDKVDFIKKPTYNTLIPVVESIIYGQIWFFGLPFTVFSC
jgi:hypothetical protein